MWLTFKAAFFFFISLKSLDDTQPFLAYILLTKLFVHFLVFSITPHKKYSNERKAVVFVIFLSFSFVIKNAQLYGLVIRSTRPSQTSVQRAACRPKGQVKRLGSRLLW